MSPDYTAYCKANNIDTSRFFACAADGNLADLLLTAQAQAGSKAHIRLTRTVFINKEKYVDNRQLEPFTAALDPALQEAGDAGKRLMEEVKGLLKNSVPRAGCCEMPRLPRPCLAEKP